MARLRILHIIGLCIIFSGTLWHIVDCAPGEKKGNHTEIKSSSIYNETCGIKSPCKFCDDIARVRVVCRMRHLCQKNGTVRQHNSTNGKPLKSYISEKICCQKNFTFNPYNFHCRRPRIGDDDKVVNSTLNILERIQIKKEYKRWIMKLLSKMKDDQEAGRNDDSLSYHHQDVMIRKALQFFLNGVYWNGTMLKCQNPSFNERNNSNEKESGRKNHTESEPRYSKGSKKRKGKESLTKDSNGKFRNEQDRKSEEESEVNMRDQFKEQNQKYGNETTLNETKEVCEKALKNQTYYCQCHVMTLLVKLKETLRLMEMKENCPSKPRSEEGCKENKRFCFLTGKCQDNMSCILYPSEKVVEYKGNKTANDSNRKERDWEKRWDKACAVMDKLCSRVNTYEEEYHKICIWQRFDNASWKRFDNASWKSNNSRNNQSHRFDNKSWKSNNSRNYSQPGTPKPPNKVYYDGPIFVFLSNKSSVLDDIRNALKKNIKISKDYYSSYNFKTKNHQAKIMEMPLKGNWSCMNSEKDMNLKAGGRLDIQGCVLRWKQPDVGCMFAMMNITIPHSKVKGKYLVVSLIWVKSKVFQSDIKIAAPINIKGRLFDIKKRSSYVAKSFDVLKLLSELKMKEPVLNIKKCDKFSNVAMKMIIQRSKSLGINIKQCEKLVPYVLGCTKKSGFLLIGGRKMECTGKEYQPRPFRVKLQDQIQIWPQYGISNVSVSVSIFFACPFESKMADIYKNLNRFFGGFKNIILPVKILAVNKVPAFSEKYAFLPPVEFLSGDRKPIPIVDIMDRVASKYKPGFKKSSENERENLPFVQNIDKQNKKAGLAVTGIFYSKKKVGSFSYQCSDENFKEITLSKDAILLLDRGCKLKFEPISNDTWKLREAYLIVRIWDGSDKKNTGIQKNVDIKGGAYSKDIAYLFISKYGCDGVVGSVAKCKPGCDNQINSAAKLDSCGVCYGGQSNQTKDSKAYKVFDKNLKKVRIACCKEKVLCNICPTANNKEDECEPACVNSKLIRGYKVCGECVGGKSGKTEDQLRDNCGNCKKDGKTCSDEVAGYISMVQPKSLNSAVKFQAVDICFVGLQKKDKLSDAVCTLSKEGLEDPFLLEKSSLKERIKYLRTGCVMPMVRKEKLSCSRWFTSSVYPVGKYKLSCKYKEKTYDLSDQLVVENRSPVISLVSPKTISPRKKIALVLEISNMEKHKKYWCCFNDKSNKRPKCFRSNKNGTSLACNVYFRKAISEMDAYVRDCTGLESNKLSLNVICKVPNPLRIETMKHKKFSMIVYFDNPIVVPESEADCKNYHMFNSYRMGVKSPVINGGELVIPKKCFYCPGGSPGIGEAKVVLPAAKCLLKSVESVNECTNLRLSPRMIGFKSCEWNVQYTDATPNDDPDSGKLDILKNGLKKFNTGFVLKHDPNVWSIAGRKLTFEMKAKNVLNQTCEATKDITVKSSDTLQCRLVKPRFLKNGNARISPKIKYCNKAKYFYEWEVKDNNTDTLVSGLETSKRNLLLNRFVLGNQKQDLAVSLIVSLQGNNTISCTTGQMIVRLKEIPLDLVLARNKKRIRTLCMKSNFVLYARTALPSLEEDLFEWSCYDDNGDLCVDKEKDTPLVLNGKKKMVIDVSSKLSCGQEYTFSVVLSRGSQSITKSVVVTVQDALPPNIRCRPFREEDDGFALVCLIKRADKNNVTFKNVVTSENESLLDMSAVSVSTHSLRKGHTKLEVFISKNLMSENIIYQFTVSASNENGDAEDVNLELKWSAPPSGCKVRVTPETGEAFKDKFTVTLEECQVGEDEEPTYRIGPVLVENDEWRYKESSISEVDIGELSEGRIKIKAEVKGMKSATFQTFVIVNATSKTADDILIGGVNNMNEAMENGDIENALGDSCRAVDGARAKYKKAVSSSDCTQPDDWDALTDAVTDNMKKAASTDEKSVKESVMRSLSCTVEKICPERSISSVKKTAFLKFFQEIRLGEFIPITKSRKRRSAESSDESVSKTFLTMEQIKSDFVTFTNALFPVSYENEDKELKKNFHAYIPPAKSSICSGMNGVANSSVSTDKLALHSQRISNFTTQGNLLTTFGEALMFGDGFQDTYDVWNCTQEDDICNGFYVTTLSIKGDVFSHSPSSDIKLLSNVFSFHFINPLDGGSFETIGTTNDAANVKVTMLEKENITKEAECQIWNSAAWSPDGCFTEHGVNKIVCKCNRFGHIAVFEVPGLLITRLQTTASPASTPMDGNRTIQNNMTGTDSTGGSTPTGTVVTDSSSAIKMKVCEVSYIGDFNDTIAAYFNSSFLKAQEYICLETRKEIKAKEDEFRNCEIREGSIIVKFTLVQKSSSINQTVGYIAKEIDAKRFIIVLPGGTNLKSDSLLVDGKNYKIEKKKDDKTTIIIAVVVSILAVLLLIIIILFLVYKKKEKRKVEPSLHGSYAEMNNTKSPSQSVQPGDTGNASGHQFSNPTYNEK